MNPSSTSFVLRQRHFIDSHKGANSLAILALMWFYGSWQNPTAWVYLATHGLYGFLWIIKSQTFPDKQFDKPCHFSFGLMVWLTLSLYWITPWIITARHLVLPGWYLALCVALFGLGIFFHFAADMQKHTHLKLAPGTLLTDGLWAHCRNPNYLGELLIYTGFSLLGRHWAPFVALGFMMLAVWFPNMVRKDKSLARYPSFAAWKQRSGMFIPYIA